MIAGILGFIGKMFMPALVPVAVDGAQSLVAKWTGEQPVPHTVDELIRLQQADTERLKTIASLNTPTGQVSQWVSNLQVYAHYFACIGVLIFGGAVELISIWTAVPADVVATAGVCLDVGIFVLVGMHVRNSRQGAS